MIRLTAKCSSIYWTQSVFLCVHCIFSFPYFRKLHFVTDCIFLPPYHRQIFVIYCAFFQITNQSLLWISLCIRHQISFLFIPRLRTVFPPFYPDLSRNQWTRFSTDFGRFSLHDLHHQILCVPVTLSTVYRPESTLCSDPVDKTRFFIHRCG